MTETQTPVRPASLFRQLRPGMVQLFKAAIERLWDGYGFVPDAKEACIYKALDLAARGIELKDLPTCAVLWACEWVVMERLAEHYSVNDYLSDRGYIKLGHPHYWPLVQEFRRLWLLELVREFNEPQPGDTP